MATTKLTVPILLEWKDIEAYMAQHDIVEVVRCRDCKYFDMSDIGGTIEPITYRCKRFARTYRYAEDFCSYGERKETEDDKSRMDK